MSYINIIYYTMYYIIAIGYLLYATYTKYHYVLYTTRLACVPGIPVVADVRHEVVGWARGQDNIMYQLIQCNIIYCIII